MLFKVTGCLIGCLRISYRGGDGRRLVLSWGLFGGYMEPHRLLCPTIFKTVLDIIQIKIRHLTNGKALADIVSNGQDIEGLNGAQRNELILPGQNQ